VSKEGGANQRANFRLEYPPADRPIFQITNVAKLKLEIIDLSEKGMRFACPPGFKAQVGAEIKGTITFHDKKTMQVEGKILRILQDGAYCAAQLSVGVPLAKMMEEQRYILQKYQK
jgi:hypothetical protein